MSFDGLAVLLLTLSLQPSDPTFAERLDAAAPFSDVMELGDWWSTHAIDNAQVGTQVITPGDLSREYLWGVGPDSSLWIQSATGETFVGEAYPLWQIGEKARARVLFGRAATDGIGYGYEDGQVYVYVSQGAPTYVVVLLILGILAFVGWLSHQLHHARRRSRELAESRRRLADSREAERLRLSRELHDGPLQDLQVIHMQMGLASHRQSGERLEETAPSVVGVIGELREITEGLRPPVLSTFGLAAAVRALAERHRATSPDTQIELDFADEGDHLPGEIRLALYRIVQEALSNALRHGGPQTVRIRYRPTSSRLHLHIEDDGTGLEVPSNLHAFETDGHLGLAGMAERAESIGGKLKVTSQPGATRVDVAAPLPSLVPSA